MPAATGAAQRPRLLAALAGREGLIVASGVLARVALRAWVLATGLGELDADEAVHGPMARHVLDGELSVCFWLQPYGGSQRAVLTAGVFAVLGSGVIQLRETVGERAARLGAARCCGFRRRSSSGHPARVFARGSRPERAARGG